MFTQTISWERAFIHAGHLGAMQFLFERCLSFARERQQFGQPIGNFQSVSNRPTLNDTARPGRVSSQLSCSSPKSSLAFFRGAVSKPSVNQS